VLTFLESVESSADFLQARRPSGGCFHIVNAVRGVDVHKKKPQCLPQPVLTHPTASASISFLFDTPGRLLTHSRCPWLNPLRYVSLKCMISLESSPLQPYRVCFQSSFGLAVEGSLPEPQNSTLLKEFTTDNFFLFFSFF